MTRGLVFALLLSASACSPAGDGDVVRIFAAASLTEAFSGLGEDDPSLLFNFLSSSDLATQIENGAMADVFASADEASMERVVQAGLTSDAPSNFASVPMTVIVPPGNPGDIDRIQDLAAEELIVSICNEACPAGRYARRVFDAAGIDVAADSLESDVRAVVGRVSIGEADAGVVYVSDALAAGPSVRVVEIPPELNVRAVFSIAVLRGASPGATRFVDRVVSEDGRMALAELGFGPP